MKIGYARVSTDEQTLDLQLDNLNAAGCEKIFSEKISAINPYKAQLIAALEYARAGDQLVVYDMTRLGRSIRDILDLSAQLVEKKIELQFLKESIDTSSPAGRLYFHIMASVAQFERDNLIQRTNAGLAAARKRGVIFGRPTALTNEQVDRAIFLIEEKGEQSRDVAQDLNIGYSTLRRYINQRKAAIRVEQELKETALSG